MLTQPVFICRHLDPRVMGERAMWGGGYKTVFFPTTLNNICPKLWCFYSTDIISEFIRHKRQNYVKNNYIFVRFAMYFY